MIVDDSQLMREIIGRYVKNNSNVIVECSSGEEAIVAYPKEMPDLVLMDVQMQLKDGFTASKEILDKNPNAKIIIITQHDDSIHQKLAMNCGAIGFISKSNLEEIQKYMVAV